MCIKNFMLTCVIQTAIFALHNWELREILVAFVCGSLYPCCCMCPLW